MVRLWFPFLDDQPYLKLLKVATMRYITFTDPSWGFDHTKNTKREKRAVRTCKRKCCHLIHVERLSYSWSPCTEGSRCGLPGVKSKMITLLSMINWFAFQSTERKWSEAVLKELYIEKWTIIVSCSVVNKSKILTPPPPHSIILLL